MKKSWGLVPKILSGEKTIESRWYQTRRAPWGKIAKGDTIYFKNSGELVTALAEVSKVLEVELVSLENADELLKKHGKKICLVDSNPRNWISVPRYAILIWLKDPKLIIKPFAINKTGFGAASAWLTVQDISVLT